MKIDEIPKWAIIVTWIGIIALVLTLIGLLIFLHNEAETLKLMGNACDICKQQIGVVPTIEVGCS